jgi:hypothetical protein
VSIGGVLRYSQADVTFARQNNGEQTTKAGGLELAGGVRFRF